MPNDRRTDPPLCLLVPGSHHTKGEAWQRRLLHNREDCALLAIDSDLPPLRNLWLNLIDQAVASAGRPVVLAGEGLGALAIAWWAALLGRTAARRVQGALLYLPSDPDSRGFSGDLDSFAPLPTAMLPFPSIVVAAEGHRHVTPQRHREMAAHWVADFVQLDHERDFGRAGWGGVDQLIDLLIAGGPGLSRYTYRPDNPHRRRATRLQPLQHAVRTA